MKRLHYPDDVLGDCMGWFLGLYVMNVNDTKTSAVRCSVLCIYVNILRMYYLYLFILQTQVSQVTNRSIQKNGILLTHLVMLKCTFV